MPTILYLTAHQPAKQARFTRSSIFSIPLALDIEDGCQHIKIERVLLSGHCSASKPPRLDETSLVYIFLVRILSFRHDTFWSIPKISWLFVLLFFSIYAFVCFFLCLSKKRVGLISQFVMFYLFHLSLI